MDNLSPEDRRKNMSHIRSRGNRSTERQLRSALVGAGISGFRLHAKTLPGKPDFAFYDRKLAVFVDGCFWHGCPNCYVRPKSSQSYWDAKLAVNKARDNKINAQLAAMGWDCIRIWEHALRHPANSRRIVARALSKAA